MVTLQKQNDALVFTFTNSQHYLQNGTITVPLGSLALVVDDSNMATFKKANSNDIFCSISLSEMEQFADKSALLTWFEENAMPNYTDEQLTERVGTLEDEMETVSGDVSTLSGKVESISGQVVTHTGDITELSGDTGELKNEVSAISGNVATLSATVNTHTADTAIHVTSAEKTTWNNKQNALTAGTGITIENDVISCVNTVEVDNELNSASTNPVQNAVIYAKIADNERVVVEALNDFSGAISSNTANIAAVSGSVAEKASQGDLTALSGQVTVNTADINSLSGQVTANTADIATVSGATAANTTALGGCSIVALTQAEYDALVTKDANTIYLING